MITVSEYTRMRDISDTDEHGVGTVWRFKNSTWGYGIAVWCKCPDNLAVQGAPASFYASAGTPDGNVKYDVSGGVDEQTSVLGAFAYNGTVDFSSSASYPNDGYCWVQLAGLSSASVSMYGAGTSAADDVAAGAGLWPSGTAGRWWAYGEAAGEYRNNATENSATLYVFNFPPLGIALDDDTSAATGVLAAGKVMFHSLWASFAGF